MFSINITTECGCVGINTVVLLIIINIGDVGRLVGQNSKQFFHYTQ